MSTTDKPVAQTADVAVNKQFIKEKTASSCLAKGKHNNAVPANIRAIKNNIIVLTGEDFIYFYAAFAISTNCLNVALSLTAISASIFLSKITLAFLRPEINLL